MAPDYATSINAHYGRDGLGAAILAGVRAAGKDPQRLTPDDVAPATEFHVGGKEATLELARLAGLQPGMQVLDVGGGLGGPARTLAGEFGSQVTVLDIIEEYCRVGEMLTALTGLSDRITFLRGDALELPFPNGSFDVVWTQHSSMNIADKERLYAGVCRVVRPGGRLALQEIMAGAASPIHVPVPWASDPSINFLRPAEAVRALISDSGFRERVWLDVSGPYLEGYRQPAAAAAAGGTPPLGVHLLLGACFEEMSQNLVRNLEEGRVLIIRAVFERPG